tara:strand:- start:245 stop:622 length:378 start_codon:yes stop_codon:yes gene_type:complete
MQKQLKKSDSSKLCDSIVLGMQENKAKDIVVLDLTNIPTAVCDFFVICSGDSSTQVDGICDNILKATRTELNEKPLSTEGKNNSEWILLDYVNVVAHIFYHENRTFYDLEDLWSDAKRTDIPNLN